MEDGKEERASSVDVFQRSRHPQVLKIRKEEKLQVKEGISVSAMEFCIWRGQGEQRAGPTKFLQKTDRTPRRSQRVLPPPTSFLGSPPFACPLVWTPLKSFSPTLLKHIASTIRAHTQVLRCQGNRGRHCEPQTGFWAGIAPSAPAQQNGRSLESACWGWGGEFGAGAQELTVGSAAGLGVRGLPDLRLEGLCGREWRRALEMTV